MGDLSLNFSRSEFACKCGCGFDEIDPETVNVLQAVRDFFDRPIKVNSGCRCKAHNESVGSTDTSRHVAGDASDIVVQGVDSDLVVEYLDELNGDELGIGTYETFVHVDTRGTRARW